MRRILISGIKNETSYVDILEKEGFVVTKVIMDSATSLLEEYQPSLIIIGTCVDSENGIDIIKEVRDCNKEIKIIAIGKTDALKEELLREGADVFLVKPVTSEELLAAVNK